MNKRILCFLLMGAMAVTAVGCRNGQTDGTVDSGKPEEDGPGTPIVIKKSEYGNPIAGFDADGKLTYGGDPAVLVDGETVYLYTGHDTSKDESYRIPEYQCYSTTDLKEWKYEGVIMNMKDVGWGDKNSAWASQVAKHYDAAIGKEMYYLYFCSWNKEDDGRQSIGVAVSESPTGPFVDKGEALINGSLTAWESSAWNDIDPTVWIDRDASGEEHIYLQWGNGKLFFCELNPDMVSVKDLNGDGKITFGGDVLEEGVPSSFTEGPWVYRRQDENGGHYGPYYLFYAYGWREQLAYAMADADKLMDAYWEYKGVLMSPSVTSNTNHPAVFDFKGKTYIIYHNGSLPSGSGYRRVACIEELHFKQNGTIERIPETATGINGIFVTLSNVGGELLAHKWFINSTMDNAYPYKNIELGSNFKNMKNEDFYWEIVPGNHEKENENYVSIESYNKPGLYVTATSDSEVVLAQDYDGSLARKQTFKTVMGLSGEGVSFESVEFAGRYLTLKDDAASLTDGSDKDACSFDIDVCED